uniref:Ribonuclease H-like domain-containing protein n=1 Tax=Tanacetum cinerariifolium TaxID=118510 RepID=A0A699HCV7_TANCI|nr:ribonuclease H-like domain-containing protein [Tanacetum cinerariifolium]
MSHELDFIIVVAIAHCLSIDMVLRALNYFLGIFANRTPTGLFLSHKKYALQLLERSHMVTCNPSWTPIDTESKLGSEGVPIKDPTLYSSLVEGLQYLTFTRQDLSYAETVDFGLLLYVSATTSLVGYTDADWASCPSTRTSTLEYLGVANVVAETAWVHNLLRELDSALMTATLVCRDNDYLTLYILLRCDSSGDLYPVTKPSTSPIAFLSISASTWHQRLGHPEIETLSLLFLKRNPKLRFDFPYSVSLGHDPDSSEPPNDNTNVVNAPQEPFVVKQDPGKNSSQSPPQINHHCCYGCGDSLEGIFCHQCTCELCGKGAHYGYNCPSRVPFVSNPKPCHNQNVNELPQTLPSFDPTCYYNEGNSFTYDSTSNLDHDSPNVFDPPSQSPLYLCEFCGNDARYGHYCIPQVPFIYPEPCYNQDFNILKIFHDFQQQYLCCENCKDPHEAYQCQPKNEDYYHEQNSCYDPNSFEQLASMCDMVGQYIQKKKEEKQIEEEQAAKVRYWKIPICYDDDDDDEDYTIAITPKQPDNSLIMGDEHLNTVPLMESDEFIKSSVENLVPNPSESKGEHECDAPAYEDFTTFSNILFDADYDFSSSDDQSFYHEDIPKEIYSNPLFDEEIISMKIDPHHFNAESDLIESLLNHDSSIISSFLKLDSLLDEFAGELTLLKSILPEINETNCDPEGETRLIKRFLYDNSYRRPREEFISENSDTAFESFSLFPIPVEDSDYFIEEIDLSFTLDNPMSPGIEEDDYDSERDILILEELLSNDSLSLPENESFHFDIPSSSCPPTKPPDCNSEILNEESPDLLPHLGHEAFQPSTACLMMIYGKNTLILDVPFLHFYPP